MGKRVLVSLTAALIVVAYTGVARVSAATDPGVGNVPQGTQSDSTYAGSYAANGVTNVSATTQQISCYRPEVPAQQFNDGPNDGYSGELPCPGATTGEDAGATPYPTQAGSNPGYPMSGPQLVQDHSESDIRVDPTNSNHLIASSKWIVSAEGYNHVLGFYESFDRGATWSVQGHIPGYEGWTDNTDPVGAFDSWGNYYEFILPYQFFYKSGTPDFSIGTHQEPNPAEPAEAVAVAVHPHGSTSPNQWITTMNGHPDFVATYDSIGNEPDKQWITIDTNPNSPHPNRIYAMWVDFHTLTPVPFVSYADARPDGTHTAWSTPQALPEPSPTPTGATYLLPHVAPNGDVYMTVTNFNPKHRYSTASVFVDKSTDAGRTWSVAGVAVPSVVPPPLVYANTTFRDGIENTFAVGNQVDAQGRYPLYVSYEGYSAGVANVLLTASYDGGVTWSSPIQVNDNAKPVDEFQPNLTVAPDGTVSDAFYDRRLACPDQGTTEAAGSGIALDQTAQNSGYTGPRPPYGAVNYCVNSSIQFYSPSLQPIGNNIRLTQHTWDPQLNAPHADASPTVTFIGDYFGNAVDGSTDVTTFVSTYDYGANPKYRQQQIVAEIAIP